jgi:hypothetical protein
MKDYLPVHMPVQNSAGGGTRTLHSYLVRGVKPGAEQPKDIPVVPRGYQWIPIFCVQNVSTTPVSWASDTAQKQAADPTWLDG